MRNKSTVINCIYCHSVVITYSSRTKYCCADCLLHDNYNIDPISQCWKLTEKSLFTMKFNKKNIGLKRYSYERYKWQLPKGYRLKSACNYLYCVNPLHQYMKKINEKTHENI